MNLREVLESVLFTAPRPLTAKRLAELTAASEDDVRATLEALAHEYAERKSGMRLLRDAKEYQLVTSPAASAVVTRFLKEEQTGTLTKAALETLTIIAYRGPMTKTDLDTIRGVNCTLILRTLMIRGLVTAEKQPGTAKVLYAISLDFLRHLGLTSARELPEYDALNKDKNLQDLLAAESGAPIKEDPHGS